MPRRLLVALLVLLLGAGAAGARQRDATGRLVPDPVRFPHGIAALAVALHARGLRLGLYTSAGTATCDARGFPGSLGHETTDAVTFARGASTA
jgi:alpha-galactosidase